MYHFNDMIRYQRLRQQLQHILTIALIVLGVVLVGGFGLRAFRDYQRFHSRGMPPGETDVEKIRGWMTIPYIARTYGVPEPVLFDALNIPMPGNERYDLRSLASRYNRDTEEVRRVVQHAILEFHTHPPHPPGKTPP